MSFIQKIMPSYVECPEGVDCSKYSPSFTFLGTEPRLLILHFIFALFLGLVVMGILSAMKRKNKIKLSYWQIILIFFIIFIVLFLLLALIFPIRLQY